MESKRARRWSSNCDRRLSIPDESEAVDGNYTILPANQQRQPLPGHKIGGDEVRGRGEAEHRRSFADATGPQVVPLARRQVGGAVTHSPDDALGQQVAQGSVDGGVRLTEDACQFRRIHEGRPAEDVEQLSFGERDIPAPKGVEGSFPMPRNRKRLCPTETKVRNSKSSDEPS